MVGSSTVLCRMKGSATNVPINCPNIVKFYNKKNGRCRSYGSKNSGIQIVPKEQDLKCCDYLKIRSEYHKVLGIGRDMYKLNFVAVHFCDKFKKGTIIRKYNIVKPPVFIGNKAQNNGRTSDIVRPKLENVRQLLIKHFVQWIFYMFYTFIYIFSSSSNT